MVAHLYHPEACLVAGTDHCDLIDRLNLDDGCCGHQQRTLIHARLESHASESAGAEHGVRIRKFGDQLYGSCLAGDFSIDQDDAAF